MPVNDDKRDWLSSAKLWSADAHFDNHQVINLESDDEGEVNNVPDSLFDNFQARQNGDGGTFDLNLVQKRSDPFIHRNISVSSAPTIQFEPISFDPREKCVGNIFGPSSFVIGLEPPLKRRRIWSADLHRRFIHVMESLGGPLATPKKIQDCMQVAGLTEDEIKSHLLKYRLDIGCEARGPSPLPPSQNKCSRFSEDMLKMSENLIRSGSQQKPLRVGESSSGQMAAAAANNTNDGWKLVSKVCGHLPLAPSHNTCSVFTQDMLKMREIFTQSGSPQMPLHAGESSNRRMAAAANKANGGWKLVGEPY